MVKGRIGFNDIDQSSMGQHKADQGITGLAGKSVWVKASWIKAVWVNLRPVEAKWFKKG